MVASIIRAYFVAVFETARHIINVGARTATYNQPHYLWQITEKNLDEIQIQMKHTLQCFPGQINQDTARVSSSSSGGCNHNFQGEYSVTLR